MLCTRCQHREAKVWRPEQRAKFEAEFGTPWPLPDDVCKECLPELLKSPEYKARMETFRRAMWARWRRDMERMEQRLRATALKVLDVADAIAGRM